MTKTTKEGKAVPAYLNSMVPEVVNILRSAAQVYSLAISIAGEKTGMDGVVEALEAAANRLEEIL